MSRALIWFQHDLRLEDNPALQVALKRGQHPIPVYVHDPAETPIGAASAWWLHHSLDALRQRLRALGSDLFLLEGDSAVALQRAAQDTAAEALYWNRSYAPGMRERDQRLSRKFSQNGLHTESFNASLLRDPMQISKFDGSPYRVFTPFWKTLQKLGPARDPLAGCGRLPPPDVKPAAAQPLRSLRLLPACGWDSEFHQHWEPGETSAWRQLEAFLDNHLIDYAEERDLPALMGTSRLSPHLHFGEISAVQIWHRVNRWAQQDRSPGAVAAAEAFLREVAWREFAHHLLFHFPHTADSPLDSRYRAFPWRHDYANDLRAWQQGNTGIPIVDAGMRQLWASGWMHNRIRMLVASILSKNLLIPWQQGAAWFLDTLVDADLANNSFGWQWSAGCGADAAPFFRIFNPVTQAKRFDADGSYVRRWVPQLRKLPNKWIHQPWLAPAPELSNAGIYLDTNYPSPIVSLDSSRKRALAAWKRMKQQTRHGEEV